jgi:hypothetical protein
MAGHETPIEFLRRRLKDNGIDALLRHARTGNYTKLKAFIIEWVSGPPIDLWAVGPQELEELHGVGPKTSRFFIMWTRPGEKSRYAALDTHVLKWMRYLGYSVPKSTPSGSKYAEIEALFLKECDKRHMTAREVDSMIWDWCSQRAHSSGEWPEEIQR